MAANIRNRPDTPQNWPVPIGAVATDVRSGLYVRRFRYPNGYEAQTHRHRPWQVVYPVYGVVRVRLPNQQVTVAPYRAIAIPPWVAHNVSAQGDVQLCSVFIDPDDPDMPKPQHEVLTVSPLLHELISAAGDAYGPHEPHSAEALILALIAKLIALAPTEGGFARLPIPARGRLRTVLMSVIENAEPPPGAIAMAAKVAMSPRHFRRVFRKELGMSYSAWRLQLRIQRAAGQLAAGRSVQVVADRQGFSSASAFGAAFLQVTGRTPKAFSRRTNT